MESEIRRNQLHPLLIILITLVAVFVSFQVVGPMLGFVLALPFYDGTMLEMTEGLSNPMGDTAMKIPLYIMQGTGTLVGLIIVPLILSRIFFFSGTALFNEGFQLQPALIILFLVVVFMGFNSLIVEWNQNFRFPEALAGLESKLKNMEGHLSKLTTFLTEFDSTAQVVLAVIVIAVLPAIGEELVFRGIIQREFYKGTQNIHVAIWVSAFIFSAIHMQFYGLVPRMFLGALFGYLFYWSGNLWMPILAHFVNNGFTVIAMYLHQQGKINVDIETTESAPLPAVLSSLGFSLVLLYLFKTYYNKRNLSSATTADDSTKVL